MQAYIDAELAVLHAQARKAAVRVSNRMDVVESDAASVQYAEAGTKEVTEQQVADVKDDVLNAVRAGGMDCVAVVEKVFAKLEEEKRKEREQGFVATSGLHPPAESDTDEIQQTSNPATVSIQAVHSHVVSAPIATELAASLSTLFHAEGDSPPSDASKDVAREALTNAQKDQTTNGVPHIIGEFIVCSILKQCAEWARKDRGKSPCDRVLIVESFKESVTKGQAAMLDLDGTVMDVVKPLFARLTQAPHWAEECVKRFNGA